MGLVILALAGLTGVAAILIVSGNTHAFSGNHLASAPSRPVSPLDEAERILGSRYAKGEITPDEYSRMISILRR
jgi:uncharacterized membrane protein